MIRRFIRGIWGAYAYQRLGRPGLEASGCKAPHLASELELGRGERTEQGNVWTDVTGTEDVGFRAWSLGARALFLRRDGGRHRQNISHLTSQHQSHIAQPYFTVDLPTSSKQPSPLLAQILQHHLHCIPSIQLLYSSTSPPAYPSSPNPINGANKTVPPDHTLQRARSTNLPRQPLSSHDLAAPPSETGLTSCHRKYQASGAVQVEGGEGEGEG